MKRIEEPEITEREQIYANGRTLFAGVCMNQTDTGFTLALYGFMKENRYDDGLEFNSMIMSVDEFNDFIEMLESIRDTVNSDVEYYSED